MDKDFVLCGRKTVCVDAVNLERGVLENRQKINSRFPLRSLYYPRRLSSCPPGHKIGDVMGKGRLAEACN